MNLRNWYRNAALRRVFLPLLKRLNPGDIRIRHHFTGDSVLLHSFRHKGYWFHGKNREHRTMDFFGQVIRPGDQVVEVGGHIGYISLYFAQLVGLQGRVMVFEPGSNNLPYIWQNLRDKPQVELVELAVSDTEGVATFYEEGLTGQNNSLRSDYGVFEANRDRAFDNATYQPREVRTVRLDDHLASEGVVPNLIKVDVEGAELLVLEGARETLKNQKPIVMVEITENKQRAFDLLTECGYLLFNDKAQPLLASEQLDFNVCALHPVAHAEQLQTLGWTQKMVA